MKYFTSLPALLILVKGTKIWLCPKINNEERSSGEIFPSLPNPYDLSQSLKSLCTGFAIIYLRVIELVNVIP